MRPSTVSRPLFYSYASNSHANVRETAGVHSLNSGLEAKRQQPDLVCKDNSTHGPMIAQVVEVSGGYCTTVFPVHRRILGQTP